MDPLNHPPEVEEGDDQAAKGDKDVDRIAVVDILSTPELDEDDYEGDGESEDDADEPDA